MSKRRKGLARSEGATRSPLMFAEHIHIVCPACGQAWVSSHPVDSPFSGVVIHAECKACRKGRKQSRKKRPERLRGDQEKA